MLRPVVIDEIKLGTVGLARRVKDKVLIEASRQGTTFISPSCGDLAVVIKPDMGFVSDSPVA